MNFMLVWFVGVKGCSFGFGIWVRGIVGVIGGSVKWNGDDIFGCYVVLV